MKIIGLTEVGEGYDRRKAYIAIIEHDELAKVANKARYGEKVAELKVGDEYPIAEGYDFRNELLGAIKAMQEAYAKFAKVAPTAARFAGLVLAEEELSQTGE